MSSDALMDELQSFLDMGSSPNPTSGMLGPNPSPRGNVPIQQDGAPSPAAAPIASYSEVKRKLDASPGHDEIGSYNLNSPAKMPKMEQAVKEEPGLARTGSLSNLRNLSSVGAMSGGTVKTEVDSLGPGGPGMSNVGSGIGFKSEPGLGDEAGDGLVGGEGHQEPPVDQDKQKCHATAARIRGALEASGLSGNLTSEDLQTLKRLNEIAKSTGLTQEQKSGEASQLLKNNPNVSRLLLKLRTEKNIQNQNSGMGRGSLSRVPEGVGMGAGGGGRMEPAYPTMQGTRPVNPTGGVYGQAGYGGPGMPGPVYRGQMPPGGQWGQGHIAQPCPPEGWGRQGMVRGGQMGMGMEMNPMGQQGMRMHPEMMGPGGPPVGYGGGGYTDPHGMRMMRMPGGGHIYNNHMGGGRPMEGMSGSGRVGGPMDRGPGTVYMNRQTGMAMYQEHPGQMPNMTGMNSRGPPGYGASSVGSPYMPSGNFHPGQMMRGEPGMSPGPRSPYGGMVPGMQRGYGSPQGAGSQGGQQGAQGGFDTFQGGDMGGRGRWEETAGRENLLTSMPRGSPQPIPPVSESQLRARLSGVTTTSSNNPNSELATRLMAGKSFESSSFQGAPAPQGQSRIVGTPSSAPGMQDSSAESLFNEINNSQFLQNTTTNNFAAGKFEDFAPEKVASSWKESQNTNDLRSSWLSRLSKALETSANINSAEAASRMAGEIEEKAFQSADTEATYTNNIAVQLARIFSQQSKGGQQGGGEGLTSTNRPDSTSWPEESAAPSSTSPDYGTNGQAHFPNDTTLNFQVNLFDPITRCGLVDKNSIADTFDLSAKPNEPKLKKHRKNCECCPGHYLSTSVY